MQASLNQVYTDRKRLIAQKMVQRIVNHLHPEKILLFGSVARNRARQTSDVDLIILKDSEKTFKERMNILYAVLEREEDVDMFWYTNEELERMREETPFIRNALKESEILYVQ
jgi:uncharacterized protein